MGAMWGDAVVLAALPQGGCAVVLALPPFPAEASQVGSE